MVNIDRAVATMSNSGMVRTLTKIGLSLSDQICISGARFVTTILLTRYDKVEQGYYAATFGFLLIATCILESMISAPFNLFFGRQKGEASQRYFGSVLLMVASLCVCSSLTFLAIWALWPIFIPTQPGALLGGLRGAFLGLAIAAPCLVVREFGRRVELARLRVGYSFLIDGAAAALQLLFICALIWFQRLTATSAYWAIGFSALIPAIVWMAFCYKTVSFGFDDFKRESIRHWLVARWPLFSQVVGLLHLQGTIWVVGMVFGAASVGVFANCNHVLLIINPLALGACSFVTPLAIRTYSDSGLEAVRRLITGFAAGIGCIMLVITLVITLNANWILMMLFKDSAYLGQSTLMLLLGMNLTLGVVHMICDQGVWAIERPQWLFHSTLITAGTTLLLAFPFTLHWGLYGAASSMLIGRLLGLIYEANRFYNSKVQQSEVH